VRCDVLSLAVAGHRGAMCAPDPRKPPERSLR
jgi:hypothetical protein